VLQRGRRRGNDGFPSKYRLIGRTIHARLQATHDAMGDVGMSQPNAPDLRRLGAAQRTGFAQPNAPDLRSPTCANPGGEQLREQRSEEHHHQTPSQDRGRLAAVNPTDGGGGMAAPGPERPIAERCPLTREALGQAGVTNAYGGRRNKLALQLLELAGGDDGLSAAAVSQMFSEKISAPEVKRPSGATAAGLGELSTIRELRELAQRWNRNEENPDVASQAQQLAADREAAREAKEAEDRARREAEAERAEEQWAGVDDRRGWMMGLAGDLGMDVDKAREARGLPIGMNPFDTIQRLVTARDEMRRNNYATLGIWHTSYMKTGGTLQSVDARTIQLLAEAGRIEPPADIEAAIRTRTIKAQSPAAQQPTPRHRLPNPATDEPVPTQKIHQRAHAQREAIAV
jgi:hypothetical protein